MTNGTDADRLRAILTIRPRSWRELDALGLNRHAVLLAASELVGRGEHRVVVGPSLLRLESVEEGFPP